MRKKLIQKTRPVAVCSGCSAYTYSQKQINKRCSRMIDDNRCEGVIRSKMRTADWQECETCHGTGKSDSRNCKSCSGYGWSHMS